MQRFSAQLFSEIASTLQLTSDSHRIDSSQTITAKEINGLRAVRDACRMIGLDVSVLHAERLLSRVSEGKEGWSGFAEEIQELQERISDEISLDLFLHVPRDRAEYYDQPKPAFGQSVQDAFPSAIHDIEEAGKCYALSRNTACVFHLQRVLEIGLKALAKALGCPLGRNSWDAHIRDIQCELERRYKAAGARTPDELFFSEVAAQFGHVKTAWRNPTMHIEKTYSDEVALDIFTATRAFMRHIATRLRE